MDLLDGWLANPGWMPHGFCLRWSPGLVAALVISNGLIGLSYYSIPIALVRLLRTTPDLHFNRMFVMFAAFIFACGTSHFIDIASLWIPLYRLEAVVLAFTAAASVATAAVMWPLIPKVRAFVAERRSAIERQEGAYRELQAAVAESGRRLARLQDSERQFRLALNNAPIGFAVVALDGRFVTVNQSLCSMLDFTEPELVKKTFQQITHPDDLDRDLMQVRELLEGRRDAYRLEKRYLNRHGEAIVVQLDVALLRDSAGQPLQFIAQVQNISARKASENALADSERRLQGLLDRLATAVVVHGPQTEIRYANPTACALLGLTIDQLLGRTAIDAHWHFVREDGERMAAEDFPVNVVARSHAPLRDYTVGVVTGAGAEPRWMLVNAEPEIGIQGEVRQIIVSFIDISERRRLARELADQARTDSLTGLANRRQLFEAGTHEVQRCGRAGAPLTVVFVDIDHFKRINDEHGHAVGDEVLRATAAILKSELREIDIAARYGGEELCLVLPDCDVGAAAQVAERLRLRVEACRVRSPAGNEVRFTASFGVAGNGGESGDLAAILAGADRALYEAKRSGRNRVAITSRP